MRTLNRFLVTACIFAATTASAADLTVLLNEKKRIGDSSAGDSFQMELGKLLAERSQRSVKFLTLPRKRLAAALEQGEADILCGYLPDWLPGPFDWSEGFIEVADVLVSNQIVTPPRTIADLAGLRIGTLHGFSYPYMESVLGEKFVRDDGPSAASNLRKLSAGRFHYAIVSQATLQYHLSSNDPLLAINPPLVVNKFKTQCAVSRKGSIGLAALNQSITAILRDGSFDKLVQQSPYH